MTNAPAVLPCREVVELVTSYLEGTLVEPERVALEAHLSECPHCSSYLEQLRLTLALAGRIEPADLSPAVREELGAAFSAWAAEAP